MTTMIHVLLAPFILFLVIYFIVRVIRECRRQRRRQEEIDALLKEVHRRSIEKSQ